jgi:predicted Fe-S protein YdhL (DUF1289 family)
MGKRMKSKKTCVISDDIVIRLRNTQIGGSFLCSEAADEIERLRAERFNWFIVARELKDAVLGTVESEVAMIDYYRLRGNLEDPRDCA